jgi:two-component system response regulator
MAQSTQFKVNNDRKGYDFNKRVQDPKKYSFLMAEDNLDDILIIKRAWKRANIKNKLYFVNDGAEALDFIYRRGVHADAPPIFVLLLDLNMPRMNGFEVLEKIKRDISTRSIPVIVLTTSNRDVDIKRAYNLGCNSYIVKPGSFRNFLDAVKEIYSYWMIRNEIPVENS